MASGGGKAGGPKAPISFAAIAIVVVAAAIGVLLLTTAAVALLPVGAKPWAAFIGVALTIVAMALASRYMTARAIARDDERTAAQSSTRPTAQEPGEQRDTGERPEA